MIEKIKEVHPDYIAFVKVRQFYKVFGRDTYIVAYLFEYKVKEEGRIITCGFPLQSINKVKSNVER